MHILAGKYKRHPLKTPKANTTRPTSSLVRKSLFDILSSQIEDTDFLDLFAGSGAIGLEALSRGAKTAIFVEKNPQAARCIRENIKALRMQEQTLLLQKDLAVALTMLTKERKTFDIIFLDPPYSLDIRPHLLSLIPLLKSHSLIIVEQSSKTPLDPAPFTEVNSRTFGDTRLHFLKK